MLPQQPHPMLPQQPHPMLPQQPWPMLRQQQHPMLRQQQHPMLLLQQPWPTLPHSKCSLKQLLPHSKCTRRLLLKWHMLSLKWSMLLLLKCMWLNRLGAYAAMPMAAANHGGQIVVGQDLKRHGIPDAMRQPMMYTTGGVV